MQNRGCNFFVSQKRETLKLQPAQCAPAGDMDKVSGYKFNGELSVSLPFTTCTFGPTKCCHHKKIERL